jgi:galactonate dehydratase
MKITDIKTYPVWVGHRNQCAVKVETDEGIYGWGEAGVSGRELAVAGAIEHYREFLLGRDPMRRGSLWQEMYRSQYFEGGRILTGAISAIDIALHDIVGKALGVPVYELLGGKHRNHIPCFASTGGCATADILIERTKGLIRNGWTVVRTAPAPFGAPEAPNLMEPRENLARTAAWLTELRQEVGLELTLGIDYHHRLSVAEAASFCQRMPTGTLDFLEEPIRDETPDAYATLRSLTGVPFAIGEEFASKWAAIPYIERGLTNFLRIDVSNVGGFTEAMKVAGWAEAHYIDLMPHNPLGPICTAASLHLAAAVPNFSWLEVWARSASGVSNDDDDLFPVRPKLTGTFFPLPEGPGLGVEVDEEKIKQQTYRHWEPPHLHRTDGSYTNW